MTYGLGRVSEKRDREDERRNVSAQCSLYRCECGEFASFRWHGHEESCG